MKRYNLNFLFLVCLNISMQAQNLRTSTVIADKITKLPLENVNIYNSKDNSITNEDGLFVFVSENKEINLSLIGYNDVKTTYDEIKIKDTVFMEIQAINLEEIIVSDAASIIKRVHENISKNYSLTPYTENFFLRCLLKKNTELVRLQDIYGKVFKDKVFNTDLRKETEFAVEILNMRKIGIVDKAEITYFEFPNFNSFLRLSSSILFNRRDNYNFTEIKSEDNKFRKINFITKEKNENNQNINGYFIISKEDYSLKEFSLDFYDDIGSIPYQEKKGHKFRTTVYRITTNYRKNFDTNKYYLSNSKLDAKVEILGDNKLENSIYDFTANLFTTNSFTGENINSNFSVDKDIFKAKFPYSADFWNNQNQLPLTQELNNFLKRVAENKDKKKEFEVIGNF